MVYNHRLNFTMGLDHRLLNYLIGLNAHVLRNVDIAKLLRANGFVGKPGESYTAQQISSILHCVRSIKRARNYHPVDHCGIDRSKNLCGDASDY